MVAPRTAGRVVGVDVARGTALLGMAAVHIFPAETERGVHPAYLVAAGRSAALFAVLAGVSLSLTLARSASVRQFRVATTIRAVLLLGLGLALSAIDSPPLVILGYYALLFVVAVPLLALPRRTLAGLAVAWALLSPLVSHLLRDSVVPEFTVGEPDLGRALPVQLAVSGIYPVLTWTTYLLLGLAVGQLDLRRTRLAWALLAGGAGAAVGARLLAHVLLGLAGGRTGLAEGTPLPRAAVDRALDAGLFGVTPTGDPGWLLAAAPHSGSTLDLLGTAGSAVAVLGLCLLLTRRGAGALLPVASAGAMTLTLYSAHVVALRQPGPLLLDDRLTLWLLHVAVGLAAATFWRLVVGRGPLEAVTTWVSAGLAARLVRPGQRSRSTTT